MDLQTSKNLKHCTCSAGQCNAMQCIVMQCSMFNAHCIAHCTLHMQYTLDILDSCVHVFMCPGAGVADLPHTGGVEIQPMNLFFVNLFKVLNQA